MYTDQYLFGYSGLAYCMQSRCYNSIRYINHVGHPYVFFVCPCSDREHLGLRQHMVRYVF